MIEASLLIVLSLLVLALTVWNFMVHHWLNQGRAQEAAHRAQMEAALQGLARRLPDAEDLLRAVAAPEFPSTPDEETEPPMLLAEEEAVREYTVAGRSLRPAEAELLAKLSRYRQRLDDRESSATGIAEAV